MSNDLPPNYHAQRSMGQIMNMGGLHASGGMPPNAQPATPHTPQSVAQVAGPSTPSSLHNTFGR